MNLLGPTVVRRVGRSQADRRAGGGMARSRAGARLHGVPRAGACEDANYGGTVFGAPLCYCPTGGEEAGQLRELPEPSFAETIAPVIAKDINPPRAHGDFE